MSWCWEGWMEWRSGGGRFWRVSCVRHEFEYRVPSYEQKPLTAKFAKKPQKARRKACGVVLRWTAEGHLHRVTPNPGVSGTPASVPAWIVRARAMRPVSG